MPTYMYIWLIMIWTVNTMGMPKKYFCLQVSVLNGTLYRTVNDQVSLGHGCKQVSRNLTLRMLSCCYETTLQSRVIRPLMCYLQSGKSTQP